MEALKNTSMMIILAGIFYGAYQMVVSEPPDWQKKGAATEVIAASDPSLPQQNQSPQNLAPQNQPLANSTSPNSLPQSLPASPNPVAWNPAGAGASSLPGSLESETGQLSQAGFSDTSELPPSPSVSTSRTGLPTGLPPAGLGNSGLPVQPASHTQPEDRSVSSPALGLPSTGLPSVSSATGSDLIPIRSQPGLPAVQPAASDALTSPQTLKAAMESAGVDIQNNNWTKALRDLSGWYQQPISVEDRDHLVGWLDRLAGDVIYSNKHTLTAGHQVQNGETLASIATRYQMPPRLLARINQYPDSIAEETPLQPGVELKVIPGPFTAEADLQLGQLTLYAGGLYAGRFKFRSGESAPLESLSEPVSFVSVQGIPAQEDQRRHEPLAPTNPFGRYCLVVGQTAVLHSPGGNSQGSCLEFSEQDMLDLLVLLPRGTVVRVVK